MRRVRTLLIAVGLLALAGGCVVPLKSGSYYLDKREYSEGIEAQEALLDEDPGNASATYYVGRYYLAMEEPEKAMAYFKRAAELEPDNADYRFWIGVTQWALMNYEAERLAYEQTLVMDPDHVSANLYLGHGYLDERDWARALAQYDKVLKLDRYNPEALYNRAVALGGLGKRTEEVAALKKFLEYYPDGSLAMKAAERLNLQGDFTYRNYIIGKRNVTLRAMAFKQWSDELALESKESLHVLEAIMEEDPKIVLHVVAYKKGDAKGARAMALGIKDYLVSGRVVAPDRLLPSWFDSAEVVEIGGRRLTVDDSVQFITQVGESR